MIYVTDARPSRAGRSTRWARLAADDERELDLAAARIGVRSAFRFDGDADAGTRPHYVITVEQRADALAAGARPVRSLPAVPAAVKTPDLFDEESPR